MTFVVTLHKSDEDVWIGHCPAIPHLKVEGATIDEARYKLWVAVQEAIELYGERGLPLNIHVEEMEIPVGIVNVARD